ncbi:hypothetical protein Oant_4576 (plasmid) [Brucella anthropi ATCC 49188]|uniref:Uncharacterized protein n=1 Tax=Brucella anthropi (strain ATCC 49188 / DSM 6882 / CCUG 24695 / JCM 21032 / LMG 3331 / NBRC 15819 / NCTC 12168 / Alc 37) TaxID=439375 RepID=A6X7Q9_BRUA4|nr:hypothetical protein Oant_4576 [Brucella anthropi ATCC 49188]SUB55784.1 Uncharacterised protein [Brucella anthropi]
MPATERAFLQFLIQVLDALQHPFHLVLCQRRSTGNQKSGDIDQLIDRVSDISRPVVYDHAPRVRFGGRQLQKPSCMLGIEKINPVLASAPLILSLSNSLHVGIRSHHEPDRHFLATFYHFALHFPFSREAVLLLPMGQEPRSCSCGVASQTGREGASSGEEWAKPALPDGAQRGCT